MGRAIILIMGLLIGVIGTGLGGVIISLIGNPSKKFMSGTLAFAGAIMVTIVFTGLLPEALEIGGVIPTLIGVIVGVLLIIAADKLIPEEKFSTNENSNAHLIKSGVVLALGIALHNIPEGLAIGVGYIADEKMGIAIALTMLIQNIPEGMSMAAPLYVGGMRKRRIIGITALSGVPMGIGVLIAALFTNISPALLSFGLGFASGAMLYIVFDDMVPSAKSLGKGAGPVLGSIIGILIGVSLSFFGHH